MLSIQTRSEITSDKNRTRMFGYECRVDEINSRLRYSLAARERYLKCRLSLVKYLSFNP